MLKSVYPNLKACRLYHIIATCGRDALLAVGMIGIGLTCAFALDSSNAGSAKKNQTKQFTSAQQALRVGLGNQKIGDVEGSVAALTYAAVNGQPLARWKLGEIYATGDGVPRDVFQYAATTFPKPERAIQSRAHVYPWRRRLE